MGKMTKSAKEQMAAGLMCAIEENPELRGIFDAITESDEKAPDNPTEEYKKGFEHGVKYAFKVVEHFAEKEGEA